MAVAVIPEVATAWSAREYAPKRDETLPSRANCRIGGEVRIRRQNV
jgi:hypothetical protein